MKSRDFCYWLQGYFEIIQGREGSANQRPDDLSGGQVKVIKDHLAMVFIHEIDPSFPPEQQEALDGAHKPSEPKPLPKSGDEDPMGTKYRC